MTVPRKLPVNIQYNPIEHQNVGTVHKTSQGGINSVPL